jgi:outer membrane biosynthesis protein TonB
MKLVGAISTAVLSLTLGVGIPAYAQQDQHDQPEEQKAKPAQDEKKAQPEKSAKPQEKNAQQDKNNAQEGKNAQQQDKNNKQEEKSAQQQDKNTQQEEKNAQQQDRNNQQEQRNAQQQQAQPTQRAGNNGGGRIPDDRYKANFGQEHRFRVSQADYRDRRFQYGGYWFGFEGVWPSNWLYTQDVYVVEIGGVYYLCNASYPGVNIALSVTL